MRARALLGPVNWDGAYSSVIRSSFRFKSVQYWLVECQTGDTHTTDNNERHRSGLCAHILELKPEKRKLRERNILYLNIIKKKNDSNS